MLHTVIVGVMSFAAAAGAVVLLDPTTFWQKVVALFIGFIVYEFVFSLVDRHDQKQDLKEIMAAVLAELPGKSGKPEGGSPNDAGTLKEHPLWSNKKNQN